MLKMLSAKDPMPRIPVYNILRDMKAEAAPAVPKMIEVLNPKDGDDGYLAILVLQAIGPAAKPAVPVLLKATHNEDDWMVADAASHALIVIDPAAARKAGVKEPETTYRAYIQQDEAVFKEKRLSISSLGDPVGSMVLWVNGDPIDFFTGGGSAMSLNSYLHPGQNDLTFSQPHKPSVYVLLAAEIARDCDGPFAGKEFSATDSSAPVPPLSFNVDRLRPLPDREALDGISHESLQKEVEGQVQQLARLINEHKGREAADLLYAGERAWRLLNGREKKQLDREAGALANALSKPDIAAAPPDQPIKILFGKRAMLAYVEMPQSGKEPAPVLKISKGKDSSGFSQILFARLNGRLVIWKVPSGISISLFAEK